MLRHGWPAKSLSALLCLFVLVHFLLFVNGFSCIGQEAQEGSANEDRVLLEVTLQGRGMVWPNRMTRVFFRLYNSGKLEYDARTKTKVERRKSRLNRQQVNELIGLAERRDFLEARKKYPALQDLRDATLITRINYTHENISKQILITNYEPDHLRATDYYPASLRRLLQRIMEERPITDYELEYGLGNVGIPSR
jgi:hypothetical protein